MSVLTFNFESPLNSVRALELAVFGAIFPQGLSDLAVFSPIRGQIFDLQTASRYCCNVTHFLSHTLRGAAGLG